MEEPTDGAVLEVHGITDDMPMDFLSLYFESKRRSGGGTVTSIRRQGNYALITFEKPADAESVLAKPGHRLKNVDLIVRRAPPRDPKKIVLSGLNPQTQADVLILYLEWISNRSSEQFTVRWDPDRSYVLVDFQEAVSVEDLEIMKMKAKNRSLQGAKLDIRQLPQTDRILVENLSPTDDKDILCLYFESRRRSNGGTVLDVTMLSGGRAIVMFQEWEAVERVLQKTQKLQGHELLVQAYYDFLQPSSLDQEPGQGQGQEYERGVAAETKAEEMTKVTSLVSVPDRVKLDILRSSSFLGELRTECPELSVSVIDDNSVRVCGRDAVRVEKLKSQILEFLSNVAEVDVPISDEQARFLSRADIRDYLRHMLLQKSLSTYYSISGSVMTVSASSLAAAQAVAMVIEQQLCRFSVLISDRQLHVLTSPDWGKLLSSLKCCEARVADVGDQISFISLESCRAENQKCVEDFLANAVPDDFVIGIEPSKLRFLHEYYQDFLTGTGQVSILPLEGDVTGLRITGVGSACAVVDELLRSIISNICSRTVTLREPGISRFLLEERGASILKQLERKCKCVIGLERVCWIMLQSEHPLENQHNQVTPSFERDISVDRILQQQPDVSIRNGNVPNLDEIQNFLASIKDTAASSSQRKNEGGNVAASQSVPDGNECSPIEEDLYTDQPTNLCQGDGTDRAEGEASAGADAKMHQDTDGSRAEEAAATSGVAPAPNQDMDDAELCLALQYSMESRYQLTKEDEELQKALKLSKEMATGREEDSLELSAGTFHGESSEAGLEEAIRMSVAEAVLSSNSAQLVVCADSDKDIDRLASELEQSVRSHLRKEVMRHQCFRNLSKDYASYLEYLQRKHAVAITLEGTEVRVHGFADYTIDAKQDIARLMHWAAQDEMAKVEEMTVARSVQWMRHCRNGESMPYSLKACTFIERAFQQKEKRVDVVFDNKPYTIDLERMEECNLGAAETVPIERKLLYLPDDTDVSSFASGQIELVHLDEASEEYCKMMQHFYDTLKDMHNKIRIIKVEEVNNPLLYQQYRLKKTSMAATQADVEKLLFHGTSEGNTREISVHGFNRSFCGKNATVYGQGVYFAVNAVISVQDQYSPPNAKGHKFVFVAKVLTGTYTNGKAEMKTPPLKENSKMPLRYDSLVDNCENPKIFVIFNDTQAYPQYLITCQVK
ncbi:protein mono-ADP-ribosyltransferase PARP10 [Stegostoma tigrinum]|uniref:protein mono-ADP-ribosyltransferase PARP10 n=1 Tax=Stegostoma tigrinum TaxID=3053191 RepID=UPI002870768A|nr:protein mono-ADP-ribosyltransferase PARP10 [Stegostoma tigrinum]XP_059496469.1 protein mono-ADP-ribosyltransferase PARP10 [Stegostoma tigrinum]XP_059496473.1 protein mono-ADP-ribosyltransferase PARP10 [Stegostoma tigrinum]XP_059496475.1 protein mono-ADP-ribosyltransferase PARP10 [Stegostoma tigrinum]